MLLSRPLSGSAHCFCIKNSPTHISSIFDGSSLVFSSVACMHVYLYRIVAMNNDLLTLNNARRSSSTGVSLNWPFFARPTAVRFANVITTSSGFFCRICARPNGRAWVLAARFRVRASKGDGLESILNVGYRSVYVFTGENHTYSYIYPLKFIHTRSHGATWSSVKI